MDEHLINCGMKDGHDIKYDLVQYANGKPSNSSGSSPTDMVIYFDLKPSFFGRVQSNEE